MAYPSLSKMTSTDEHLLDPSDWARRAWVCADRVAAVAAVMTLLGTDGIWLLLCTRRDSKRQYLALVDPGIQGATAWHAAAQATSP